MVPTDPENPDVLLVNSPTKKLVYKEDRCQNDANEVVAQFFRPPISLIYLGGIAKSVGFSPSILDCPAQYINFKELKKIIKKYRPKFVAVNASVQTVKEDLLVLKIAKKFQCKTISFGYYPTIYGESLLDERDFIDNVILYEPEYTFKEILEGKPLENILGLGYKSESGETKINDKRPFIKNLDDLPFPTHDLLDLNIYRHPINGQKFLTIQVSRGCPFRCRFCLAETMNGLKLRTRSVQSVLKEIEFCITKFKIRKFFLRADTFTANKTWVKNFCLEILKRGIKLDWYTNTRIDTLNPTLIKLMARAGCLYLSIGVETANPRLQKLLGKNLNLLEVKHVLSKIKASGIHSIVYFLMGTPYDTEKTLLQNIHFSRNIQATFVEFTPFVDFKGISLNKEAQESKLSREKVIEYSLKGRLLFYGRISKILEIMIIVAKDIIKSPIRIFYFVKSMFNYGLRVLLKNIT